MPVKGAAFERAFSKQLSKWVSNGARDDIFWRSPGSGGWASRKTTSAQGEGDIVALDPLGQDLLKKVTIELKCGYNKDFPKCFYCFDKPTILDDFIKQAKDQANKAMTPYWWLVWRMDRLKPLIFYPSSISLLVPNYMVMHDGQVKMTALDSFIKERSYESVMRAMS